ncbi:aldo/keto reductase [Nitriliruptor alkaliphilus]|uniref:aldo/keto reductase n=1 Tax=Nitriliruptor alkaliphilus TaxID=427918 RepID=UPI000698DB64|nr:aldo/keto reductase [Nitriliruptor alkaliphilus]
MQQRVLGQDLTVSALGLGCMGMSFAYGGADEARSVATLERAIERGVTLFDTADIYGPETNERLVGPVLARHRDDVVLATKFGAYSLEIDGRSPDGRPDYAARACDASLLRLGVDVIDLYYLHRVDPQVPVEESIGAMADLVTAGKVRHLGISEATAEQLRRAHATHPISALQSEWSLWTRDLEREVLATARELGIGLVPYSPLGRGFLTGTIRSVADLPEGDWRRGNPRFAEQALAANLRLVEVVESMAADHAATAAQVALAWVLAQGDDVVPIPGTTRPERLDENLAALDVSLNDADLRALDQACPPGAATGTRYAEAAMRFVAT